MGRIAGFRVRLRNKRHEAVLSGNSNMYSRDFDEVLHVRAVRDVFFIFKFWRLQCVRMRYCAVEWKALLTSFCVMYIISSISARSLGKGKRFWTSSSRVIPVDQTSDLML